MDWYQEYLFDHPAPVGATNERREKIRKNRLQKAVRRATILEQESIDGLTRDQAQAKLEARANQEVAGMSGIGLFVLRAVLSWLIGRLLTMKFGKNEESS
jgi:hypothetical protein